MVSIIVGVASGFISLADVGNSPLAATTGFSFIVSGRFPGGLAVVGFFYILKTIWGGVLSALPS
jgi:hypothetical protein